MAWTIRSIKSLEAYCTDNILQLHTSYLMQDIAIPLVIGGTFLIHSHVQQDMRGCRHPQIPICISYFILCIILSCFRLLLNANDLRLSHFLIYIDVISWEIRLYSILESAHVEDLMPSIMESKVLSLSKPCSSTSIWALPVFEWFPCWAHTWDNHGVTILSVGMSIISRVQQAVWHFNQGPQGGFAHPERLLNHHQPLLMQQD